MPTSDSTLTKNIKYLLAYLELENNPFIFFNPTGKSYIKPDTRTTYIPNQQLFNILDDHTHQYGNLNDMQWAKLIMHNKYRDYSVASLHSVPILPEHSKQFPNFTIDPYHPYSDPFHHYGSDNDPDHYYKYEIFFPNKKKNTKNA